MSAAGPSSADRSALGDRSELLDRAARNFERAGRLGDAARCVEKAGAPKTAARLFEENGDPAGAARLYERAGDQANAARCHLEAGDPNRAADCWRAVRRVVDAGWVLITRTDRVAAAWELFNAGRPETLGVGQRLLRELGLGLYALRTSGAIGRLETALVTVEREIGSELSARARLDLAEQAVYAADRVDRVDLSARVLAAAYQARTPGVATFWQQWAVTALGGTVGVPTDDEPVEAAPRSVSGNPAGAP
jgi:tetratricopeptide (TPR) repeat protein